MAINAEPEVLHPRLPVRFVFSGHAASHFNLAPIRRRGKAGALSLPVAFPVFESGEGEAKFGGGFGRFDTETHAISSPRRDGHIGTVENGLRIAGFGAKGTVNSQRTVGSNELHVLVGTMVEAPAFDGVAIGHAVEVFGKQRLARLVGPDFVDACDDRVTAVPGKVVINGVPLGRGVADVAILHASGVAEQDVSLEAVATHHRAVVADGVLRMQIHAAHAGPGELPGYGFVAFDHGLEMVRVIAVLSVPAVQIKLKLPAEGKDIVFDHAIARVVQVDGRVGDPVDDVADDIESARVVVRVQSKGKPWML